MNWSTLSHLQLLYQKDKGIMSAHTNEPHMQISDEPSVSLPGSKCISVAYQATEFNPKISSNFRNLKQLLRKVPWNAYVMLFNST